MVWQKVTKSENDAGSEFMKNTKNIHVYKKRECSCICILYEYMFYQKKMLHLYNNNNQYEHKNIDI
jgi:hypothetical protein